MIDRKICPCCNIKPVAICNYQGGEVNYRSKCDQCYRKRKSPITEGWIRSGYKRKNACEKCNFKFKLLEQAAVHHIDANIHNNDWLNLRTVCLNCQAELKSTKWVHRASRLNPD